MCGAVGVIVYTGWNLQLWCKCTVRTITLVARYVHVRGYTGWYRSDMHGVIIEVTRFFYFIVFDQIYGVKSLITYMV